MSLRRRPRQTPALALASLLALGAGCASARELTVTVEPDEGVDASQVEVELSRRPTRKVPFVSCDPDYNLLGGYFQCELKPDRTERLKARRDGQFLRFGPVPERRFGPSGYRVEQITIRTPSEVLQISEEQTHGKAALPAPESAWVHYDSVERRALFGAPREPPAGPIHPVHHWLASGWPSELVVRPKRIRWEDRKLIGAIWEGLRERGGAVRDPAVLPEDATWGGWRMRRRSGGPAWLEHQPTGALVAGGPGKGPGTIRLPLGRAVALPIAPPPRDDPADPAREETLEVIAVPASEASGLEAYWGLGGGYGDGRGGTLEENAFALPIERWRALAEQELHPAGLEELELAQGTDCGAPSLDGAPLVCVRLKRTGDVQDTLLLAAVYRETDTQVWALAYRLVGLP